MKCDTCRHMKSFTPDREAHCYHEHWSGLGNGYEDIWFSLWDDCEDYEYDRKKGEVKAMKLELGERRVTVLEVVAMLPECGEAVKLFRDWFLCGRDTIRPIRWLEMHPEAIPWAIEKGFVKEAKPVHDWSGLEIEAGCLAGRFALRNKHNGTYLLRFYPDGRVERARSANEANLSSIAGHFDDKGRIIIDGEGGK